MNIFSDTLIVSDFDYTLTGPDGTIPKANISAIGSYIAQGGLFTVATGRARVTLQPHIKTFGVNAPAILFNGAIIHDFSSRMTFEMHPLPAAAADMVADIAAAFPDAVPEIYTPNAIFSCGNSEWRSRHSQQISYTGKIVSLSEVPFPWLNIVFVAHPDTVSRITEYARARYSDDYSAHKTLPFLVELQRRGVSKGAAARRVLELCGRQRLVCIGDAENDIAMLEAADLAFVPQSAEDGMKCRGYRPADHCGVGSIASVIEYLTNNRCSGKDNHKY